MALAIIVGHLRRTRESEHQECVDAGLQPMLHIRDHAPADRQVARVKADIRHAQIGRRIGIVEAKLQLPELGVDLKARTAARADDSEGPVTRAGWHRKLPADAFQVGAEGVLKPTSTTLPTRSGPPSSCSSLRVIGSFAEVVGRTCSTVAASIPATQMRDPFILVR
jgi:hypothetical protein